MMTLVDDLRAAETVARFWEADAARQTRILGKYEALRPLVTEMLDALQSYGFPVSDVAKRALMDSGSVEAQRVHSAAELLRLGLDRAINAALASTKIEDTPSHD